VRFASQGGPTFAVAGSYCADLQPGPLQAMRGVGRGAPCPMTSQRWVLDAEVFGRPAHTVVARFGDFREALDVIVNNAGGIVSNDARAAHTVKDWGAVVRPNTDSGTAMREAVLMSNLTGVFCAGRAKRRNV